MVWLVSSLPHMEKAVVGIPAFPCAHRRMSACGLLWYDKGFANWLTVTMERERISFGKWHDIYPFLSKYPSLGTRKTLLSWLQNDPYLVHRRRHNMIGPGLPKSASSDWSQLWLAETIELRHPPARFKLSGNTSGAFTMLELCPTASFTQGCLKKQHRPNPSWSLNFLRPCPIHVTNHRKQRWLYPTAPCDLVSNKTESPASPNLIIITIISQSPQPADCTWSVTAVQWSVAVIPWLW